jgi:mannose-6-phosphate isomerase-like protein (cupin superfamily)
MTTTTGQIIENPATGERCRWLLTAAETDGALVRAEVWVRPGGGVGEHVHDRSEERFEVLEGRLILGRGDERHVLLAGEHGRVPAGTPHQWRNGGDDELHFVVEVDQPGQFEALLEGAYALARAGRCNAQGQPNLFDVASLLRRHPADTHPTRPPRWVQRLLLPPLALIGGLRKHPA